MSSTLDKSGVPHIYDQCWETELFQFREQTIFDQGGPMRRNLWFTETEIETIKRWVWESSNGRNAEKTTPADKSNLIVENRSEISNKPQWNNSNSLLVDRHINCLEEDNETNNSMTDGTNEI